ncbi:MAG: TIGR03087 family PEP-CTERM/XrtA system glycosyltransferase [Planctomycetes bacterium]|nr:TIGR03087 family PEP-CTERM/XrtA system glycosyltransferase [Planctomycetota bacterium]
MPLAHRPKLLYLTHRVPYPPDKGDRIRTYHFLRFLADRADVYLASLADEPVDDDARRTLESLCREVAIAPAPGGSRWLRALGSLARGRAATQAVFHAPELQRRIKQWATLVNFEVLLASSSGMAPYFEATELRDIPAVVDLIDVDSQKWLDYGAARTGVKGWLYRLEGRRLRKYEEKLAQTCRALTLVSQAETALFRSFCSAGEVQAIANGVDLDYFQVAPQADEPICVFVGALDYHPNVAGICWFCKSVWPAIHACVRGARLMIVGRKPVRAILELDHVAGVEVVGQVPDVRPYVAKAALAVVPLQIARGIQNKVLEALACWDKCLEPLESILGLPLTLDMSIGVDTAYSEIIRGFHKL